MKYIASFLIALVFATPAFALADDFGVQPTLGQLLSRLAALKAIEAGTHIGCEVASTVPTARVGVPFTIAWGSYGADNTRIISTDPLNHWTPQGEQALVMDTPGRWTWEFKFFADNGESVDCKTSVVVTL
jgi:hypothetical protein